MIGRGLAGLIVALTFTATGAMAEMAYATTTYNCARGAVMMVTYVNDDEGAIAVLHVEGRQIVLEVEPSGSGARYGRPSDGSHYIWWAHGTGGTLFWRDGAADSETVILSDCIERT